MPAKHATLPPSSASRWISCPASVGLIAALPEKDESSVYAEEGTAAHALAAVEAAFEYGLLDVKERIHRDIVEAAYPEYMSPEMDEYVAMYVDAIGEALEERENAILLLEQHLETGIPQCWGTSDAVVVSPTHVHIIDFKYGRGVKVSAVDNPQLRLYAVSALETYGDILGEVEDVAMTIFQPRIGNRSTAYMKAKDLRAWRDSIIPIAEEALEGDSPRFGPSEKACRWCPLKGSCRAQMEAATAADFTAKPDFLDNEEISELLHDVPLMKAWLKDLEAEALKRAYEDGEELPGWKVVLRGGRRSFPDGAYAVQKLIEERGYNAEEVAKFDVKPLGELEKVIGKDGMKYLEDEGLLVKSPGSPALVKGSAPGEPINSITQARKDFE